MNHSLEKKEIQGKVVKSTGSFYTVKTADGKKHSCVVKGLFRIKGIKATNPIAVGDYVLFEKPDNIQHGMISEVLDRKNYIIRKSTNLSKQSHVVAANIDHAVLIITLKLPETPVEFIDRFLATAEAYKIKSVLIFNKIDLYNKEELEILRKLKSIYEAIGYRCIETSAVKNINIDLLKELFRNKTSLISGISGVGKSTLINIIEPGLDLKTAPISDYHSAGIHTTTFAELFDLTGGGEIIDTPGIRGFGLVDMNKNEIYHFFPEIFNVSKSCKFYNCIHIHEPGCAVIEAVNNGQIAESRYKSYLSIYEDKNEKYR
jgi:ribosome biogenesis GTPase / thiamine phosphate phosphatase